MEDVVPELLSKIKKDFDRKYNSNKTIKKLLKKLDDDDLNHQISLEYASNVGNVLKEVFDSNLSSKTLPDGKLYFNIADRIINDTLENNFNLITDYCDKVQKSLNDVAKIKIKPIKPTLNQDKVKGIIEIVSGKDDYNDVAYMLGEPIVNFSQCIVDDYVKANADFHSKSGMKAQIIRTSNGKCCDWCNKLVGVYDYEEVKNGHDVFRRHRHCDCVVEYKTINGRAQNVHTKYWKKIEESVKIEERKKIGLPIEYKEADEALEKELKKSSKRNWNKLIGSDANALKEYSKESFGITNRLLRNALEETDDIVHDGTVERIKGIDRVLSKNILGHNLILYRGVSYEEFEYLKQSDTFETYKSSSIDFSVTDTFDEVYKVKIKAHKNTKGFYLGDFSEHKHEKEFLIHRGQKYKIVSIKDTEMEIEIIE